MKYEAVVADAGRHHGRALAKPDFDVRMADRRAVLRQSTAEAHAAVDAAIGAFASMPDYRRYLAGVHAFRAPIEASLPSWCWPDALASWKPIMIRDALDRDMLDLGCPTARLYQSWKAPRDVSELMGTLYVLEGSSLGARLLYGRARDIGLTAEHGARHLAKQSASFRGWSAFLHLLETIEPFDANVATSAAIAAFKAATVSFRGTQ